MADKHRAPLPAHDRGHRSASRGGLKNLDGHKVAKSMAPEMSKCRLSGVSLPRTVVLVLDRYLVLEYP